MKVNVDQVFTEIDGTPIKDGSIDFTLKIAAIRALNSPDKISEEEKLKRFNLARKIYKGGEIVLTAEECALVKQCIHRTFDAPLVYAEANEMIEGIKEG